MAPSAVINGIMTNGMSTKDPRKPYEQLRFDPSFKPKSYQIKGTPSDSKILFEDVKILDSTGRDPYRGDVYIEGERIRYVGSVPDKHRLTNDPAVRLIPGNGRTLMSGLGDAHTHFTWNGGDLNKLGELGVEEHTLVTAQSAKTYLDSGYTMCFGAASAKERLDCVIRDAINDGRIPGPRYLANGKEMAVPEGELVAGITAFAKGPLEMREVIRHQVKLSVDQIKLSMSGEEICEVRSAQDCYFSDEETAACVDEAHRLGVRLCGHARARDSVKMCVRHGVDVIYHASWIDEEGMEMLEKRRERHVVAPGINWLWATLYESQAFGYSFEKAEKLGYKRELDAAVKGLREMHRRGIAVLPGGDYGFAWTPHGTYARDLEHFVKLLDFTPMESILAATAGVAKLFMREDELGMVRPGYFADLILVDGNPLDDITVLQDHSKLNAILINGRIHKLAQKEEVKVDIPRPIEKSMAKSLTNYVTFEIDDGTGRSRIGHLDEGEKKIMPLSYASGTPLSSLYEVIEIGSENIISGGEPIPLDSVKILPPLTGRDVLAIGKNYSEHAKEFNASGYDASDKVDMPTHPVVFTKRATSIIAHGEEILPLQDFTSTLDYEGEIGVIIGKAGHRISEEDAEQYVWGYTIINDVTARERQRDHKQFYIGKSGDTFCPMGPIAVPVKELPKPLRVTTKVNGELRQEGTTDDLIFSVSNLIKTLSESQTLRPGDVIATGTPAGVGFGLKPPKFLQPGDVVEISVSGLGTLKNKVAEYKAANQVQARVSKSTTIPMYNLRNGGIGLTTLPSVNKQIYVKMTGKPDGNPIVFIHGLGGSHNFYTPLISSASLADTHSLTLYDLEGHGLSPTKATSIISISSYASDLHALLTDQNIPERGGATLVAHSMGCLVALTLALTHPSLVKKLILIGPPPTPLPKAAAEASYARAKAVRDGGMLSVASTVASATTSAKTQSENPLAYAAVLQSLLSQDPEGYAKGCTALAGSSEKEIKVEDVEAPTLVVSGNEDKVIGDWAGKLVGRMRDARAVVLKGVGHWVGFEDAGGLGAAVGAFV